MGRPERRLDPNSGSVAVFALSLRELRRAAGNPSYRELALRAGFSPSVLSSATSGFSLPTLRVTLAFVRACGGDDDEWTRRWRAVAQASGAARPPTRSGSDPAAAVAARSRRPVRDEVGEHPPAGREPALPQPAQLPVRPRPFVGRLAEAAALTRHTAARTGEPVLIHGVVGVGKSALAVHVSHEVAADFPDGLLYADLSAGFAPEVVLADLLRALGTPPELVPQSSDQRSAMFRSLLAQRRVLVLLDNAADESQLRALLAEAPYSLMLITSRARMAGIDGIERFGLDVLTPEESVALIAAIAGPDQVAADPAAARQLADLCDHLPLAIRIATFRIALRPGRALSHAVDELREESRRLDHLHAGDLDVRGRMRSGFARLDEPAERALRHIARCRADEIFAHRLARLLRVPCGVAEDTLEFLVDVGLARPAPGAGAYRIPLLFRICADAELGPWQPDRG